MNEIKIIQGDTCNVTVRFSNVDISLIKKVYFSCKELEITKELMLVDDRYVLELSCNETCDLKKTICCYDLTVYFQDESVKTVEYRGRLTVLEKYNKVMI